jgi:hypothetical protein
MAALSDHKSSAQASRLTRLFFWVVLLMLLLTPFVAAEAYLRSIGLGDPTLYYGNTSFRYAPRPNQRHVGRHGVAITLDSKGLRGVKDWTTPADRKILFLGASVTWGGSLVDDNDLYSNVVCENLRKKLNHTFVCGNGGVNSYGVDNIAERIRYSDFADESTMVVTVTSYNTTRGLADLDSLPYLTENPPGPFKALWEAATLGSWKLLHILRHIRYQDAANNVRVAKRSLDNLLAALRETDRPDRKVLIVLLPAREELNGNETDLTRSVIAVLEGSGLDFLNLHQPISAAPRNDAFFYPNEGHLEVAGHRFVGDRISEKLEDFFARQP